MVERPLSTDPLVTAICKEKLEAKVRVLFHLLGTSTSDVGEAGEIHNTIRRAIHRQLRPTVKERKKV